MRPCDPLINLDTMQAKQNRLNAAKLHKKGVLGLLPGSQFCLATALEIGKYGKAHSNNSLWSEITSARFVQEDMRKLSQTYRHPGARMDAYDRV